MKIIHTDPNLLNKMRKAIAHPISKEDIRAQRISWIVGQIGYTVAHSEIARILEQEEGMRK